MPTVNRASKSLLYYCVFYKYFYKFMFLHKPLCDKYRHFSFKIGDMYFCKSCVCLYTGMVVSLMFLWAHWSFLSLLGLYFVVGVVSYPSIYNKIPRLIQYIIRFFDGFTVGSFLIVGFQSHFILGLIGIGIFLMLKNLYNKKRKSIDICSNCPKMQEGCDGYTEQKEALLKIEEEYSKKMSEVYIKKKGL